MPVRPQESKTIILYWILAFMTSNFQTVAMNKFTANRIVMNLYASVDEYGYRHNKVQRITGHRSGPDAIPKSESHVTD